MQSEKLKGDRGPLLLVPKRLLNKEGGRRSRQSNPLVAAAEAFYDKCAGYNLRYCPFRGSIGRGNKSRMGNAFRDIAVLCCFIIANLVVFLTITARTMFTVSLAIFDVGSAVKRYLEKTAEQPMNKPVQYRYQRFLHKN